MNALEGLFTYKKNCKQTLVIVLKCLWNYSLVFGLLPLSLHSLLEFSGLIIKPVDLLLLIKMTFKIRLNLPSFFSTSVNGC